MPSFDRVLHDLNAVAQALVEKAADAPETQLLIKCQANLLRKFAEI
jgi:PKHD-type hydroxylase C-terminal domain